MWIFSAEGIDFVYCSYGNIDSLVMMAEEPGFTRMSICVLFKSSLSWCHGAQCLGEVFVKYSEGKAV